MARIGKWLKILEYNFCIKENISCNPRTLNNIPTDFFKSWEMATILENIFR